jgi:large subunit ribosomal protein L35
MPKLKPHKGLLKRVRITGKGKIKFHASGSGHLRSHKTGKQMRALRKKRVAKAGDIGRFERLLGRTLIPGERRVATSVEKVKPSGPAPKA